MESLYDRLSALERIDGAYEAWSGYRRTLTDFITESIPGGCSAVLIGAGPCNDLDLLKLRRHFSSLLLTDRTEEPIRKGIRRQGMSPEAFDIAAADILGIPDDAYRTFDAEMQQQLKLCVHGGEEGARRFTEALTEGIRWLYANGTPDGLYGRVGIADFAVCCGVHSQLLAPVAHMVAVYRRYLAFDAERVFSEMSRINGETVRVFNGSLVVMASRGVLTALETERIGIPGGIEGARQAALDMESRNLFPGPKAECVWSFDASQNKLYRMELQLWEKKPQQCGETD